MYNVLRTGSDGSILVKESRSEVNMIVNGKELLDIIREGGPREDFDDTQ